MARTIISPYEQNLVETIRSSSKDCLSDGVSIDTNADGSGDSNVLTSILPVPDFNKAFSPGSQAETKLNDGLRQSALPIVKHMAPIGWSEGAIPTGSFSFGTGTLLTINVPVSERPSVDRRMVITAHISGFVTNPNTVVNFFVSYSNLSTASRRFTFTEASSRRSFSGSWVVEVPARVSSFSLNIAASAPVSFDSNDSYSLAVWG